jgi:hypothetical protein
VGSRAFHDHAKSGETKGIPFHLPGRLANRVAGKFEGRNCTVINTESIDF